MYYKLTEVNKKIDLCKRRLAFLSRRKGGDYTKRLIAKYERELKQLLEE